LAQKNPNAQLAPTAQLFGARQDFSTLLSWKICNDFVEGSHDHSSLGRSAVTSLKRLQTPLDFTGFG
jgi:hypothetical protein